MTGYRGRASLPAMVLWVVVALADVAWIVSTLAR
jgi:hypothetical protein